MLDDAGNDVAIPVLGDFQDSVFELLLFQLGIRQRPFTVMAAHGSRNLGLVLLVGSTGIF